MAKNSTATAGVGGVFCGALGWRRTPPASSRTCRSRTRYSSCLSTSSEGLRRPSGGGVGACLVTHERPCVAGSGRLLRGRNSTEDVRAPQRAAETNQRRVFPRRRYSSSTTRAFCAARFRGLFRTSKRKYGRRPTTAPDGASRSISTRECSRSTSSWRLRRGRRWYGGYAANAATMTASIAPAAVAIVATSTAQSSVRIVRPGFSSGRSRTHPTNDSPLPAFGRARLRGAPRGHRAYTSGTSDTSDPHS